MFRILGKEFADHGFYINLDISLDRKLNVERQITDYKIEGLERFSAIRHEYIASACTRSHLAVFNKAKSMGLETICVLEDDFDIRDPVAIPNGKNSVPFSNHLSHVHTQLSSITWDVFLLGYVPRCPLIAISKTDNLCKVPMSTGGWAYLIKRRAYEYLLEHSHYERDKIAIDDWLPLLGRKGFEVVGSIPFLIHHAVGFESTLNPRGSVNYDQMIEGYFRKFYSPGPTLNERLSIVITGHVCEDYLSYLNYLMKSLPECLKSCKFIFAYDAGKATPALLERAIRNYLAENHDGMNYELLAIKDGSLSNSIKTAVGLVTTPYFVWLEHDWVFLDKERINFTNLLRAFDSCLFVNAVWFNKDDNNLRGFDIAVDVNGKGTPYAKEDRVSETDLVTCCRWSNNPAVFRTSKFKEWMRDYAGSTIEEDIIPIYRKQISENRWEDIRDKWGTFLYGKVGDDPYVGHTDASRRYLTPNMRNAPEINGDAWIEKSKLPKIPSPRIYEE